MFKRLRWLIIGYIIGVFTFDILKRELDERFGENKTYSTITETIISVTDFNKNKNSAQDYIDES
ncbi:MAG: hypothetical protein KBF89_02205 [Acidimicrobiia bacterium]|nr:hypothetical protein [Acidimicrobiia bacterium]